MQLRNKIVIFNSCTTCNTGSIRRYSKVFVGNYSNLSKTTHENNAGKRDRTTFVSDIATACTITIVAFSRCRLWPRNLSSFPFDPPRRTNAEAGDVIKRSLSIEFAKFVPNVTQKLQTFRNQTVADVHPP